MRIKSTLLCAVLATFITTVGCGDETPSGPTTLDGTWRGTYRRGTLAGTLTLEMAQSGAGLTGTWSADLEGTEFDQAGSFGGTVTGSTVALFLNPGPPLACGLSGTLGVTGSVDGNRLTGDYVVFECDSVATGRIDVTKQ